MKKIRQLNLKMIVRPLRQLKRFYQTESAQFSIFFTLFPMVWMVMFIYLLVRPLMYACYLIAIIVTAITRKDFWDKPLITPLKPTNKTRK